MEAPSGFEPLDKGFADLPLNHLGTAPRLTMIPPTGGQGLRAEMPVPAASRGTLVVRGWYNLHR